MIQQSPEESLDTLARDVSLSEKLWIERICSRLVLTYCTAADRHDLDSFLSIFAPDARWHQADGSVFLGHAQIREYFVGRPRTPVRSHLCSNVRIDVLDMDSALGMSMSTVLREQPAGANGERGSMGIHAVLEYQDEYRRQSDGEWKIVERKPRLIYSAV